MGRPSVGQLVYHIKGQSRSDETSYESIAQLLAPRSDVTGSERDKCAAEQTCESPDVPARDCCKVHRFMLLCDASSASRCGLAATMTTAIRRTRLSAAGEIKLGLGGIMKKAAAKLPLLDPTRLGAAAPAGGRGCPRGSQQLARAEFGRIPRLQPTRRRVCFPTPVRPLNHPTSPSLSLGTDWSSDERAMWPTRPGPPAQRSSNMVGLAKGLVCGCIKTRVPSFGISYFSWAARRLVPPRRTGPLLLLLLLLLFLLQLLVVSLCSDFDMTRSFASKSLTARRATAKGATPAIPTSREEFAAP